MTGPAHHTRLKMGERMDVDKITPCCHAELELVHQRCTSEFWGTEVTEKWEEIHCTECGHLVEAQHLLDALEVEDEEVPA